MSVILVRTTGSEVALRASFIHAGTPSEKNNPAVTIATEVAMTRNVSTPVLSNIASAGIPCLRANAKRPM